METKIEIQNASVTYRVQMEKTTSLKEWAVNKVTGKKWVAKEVKEVQALNNINLTINHGERLGIIGLNGAGKSTLLKLIAGLVHPTEGSIQVTGTVQPLIEIGAGFNFEFTGRENIYFNGAMLGFSKKEIKQFEQEVVDFSELGDSIDMPVKYYSSGMVARLAFSIATNIKPEILVLDEMLSAGDINFVGKARERMSSLIDSAKLMVIVSHDLNLVRELCTSVLILVDGRVSLHGPSKEMTDLYLAGSSANHL